ncbi:hypothetical protein niasHT_024998 [Heterodera trifolii]|uniref:Uncharacterized protein n=1 Tax=Heterodera trifolii TaxID=157864 RepID=A0ABD2KSY3_9BILA
MEMNATNLLPYNANSSNPSMAVPSSSGSNWWWAPGQKTAEEAEASRAAAAAAGQPTNEQIQQADNEQTLLFVATTVEAMLSQIPGISHDILASINLSQQNYCQNFAAMISNLLLQNYDEEMPRKILTSLTLPNEYLQSFEKMYRLKLLNLEKLADKGQMGKYVLEKKLLNLRIFADFFLTLSNICKTKQNQNNALANSEISGRKLANLKGFLEICFELFYKQIAQAIIEQRGHRK